MDWKKGAHGAPKFVRLLSGSALPENKAVGLVFEDETNQKFAVELDHSMIGPVITVLAGFSQKGVSSLSMDDLARSLFNRARLR